MAMKCIKLDKPNRRVVYTEHEIPRVEHEEEVVVRITIAGVCGTDLHIIDDKFDAKDRVILGHEMAGFIHETPRNCKGFKKGDRVVVNPNIACGRCRYCSKSLYNFCEAAGKAYTLGIWTNGGWAEYCKAHISLIVKIPDDVTYDQAVLCEPLSCIVHAIDRLPSIPIGSNILIIGAGIIGLLWSSVLHVMGHRSITISEPDKNRQQTAIKLGLGINCSSWEEILEENKNSTDWKIDLCIDCSGNVAAIQSVFPTLQLGATLLIFGVADPSKTISVAPFDLYKRELTVMGAVINTPTSFQKSVSLIGSLSHKYISLERMAMKKFKLADFEEALHHFKNRTYSKIVFEI